MHVDDVGDRPKLMQRGERFAAADPRLERHEEEQRGAEQNDDVRGGFERLDEVGDVHLPADDRETRRTRDSGDYHGQRE